MKATIIFTHNGKEERRNVIEMTGNKGNMGYLELLLDEIKATIETYHKYVFFDTIDIKIEGVL